MELKLVRTNLQKTYTEGELWVDGKFFCFTVEDKVRAKAGLWIRALKVYEQTAIPYGRYQVMVTWSNRFKRQLPAILNVPDFEGIRIHNGTSALSSAGCPIISYKRIGPGQVLSESNAMNMLCDIVQKAQQTEKIFINILEP